MSDFEGRFHARNAPSGASAWMRCLGMLNFLLEHEIEDVGGVAADEGSAIHSFCEDAILQNVDAYKFIGETRTHNQTTVEMTEALADDVQSGIDFIDTKPGKIFVEKWVSLRKWFGPNQGGTLDIGIVGKKEIVIFDWKWGYLPVSPIRNYQLMLYALGFYYQIARFHTDATVFRLVIWQPRAPGGGGEWTITLNELEKFGAYATKRAKMTRDPDAPRIAGDIQCAYCPGAKLGLCPEYDDWNLRRVVEDFERFDEDVEMDIPPHFPKIETVTPERRSYLIKHKASFNKFIERLEAREKDDYLKGLPTPHRKGVLGRRPARQWSDKDDADKRLTGLLGEDRFTKKLLSPTQAEEELNPALYLKLKTEGLIVQGEPQMTMVDAEDSRDPVPTYVDMFED